MRTFLPFKNHALATMDSALADPTPPGPTILYSEDFESYTVGDSLIGVGDAQYTVRVAGFEFSVLSGKWGRADGPGAWGTGSCNAAALATVGDCEFSFKVVLAPGGRAMIGWHLTSAHGYWMQILHATAAPIFKVTNNNGWDFINSTNNLVLDATAICPSVLPYTGRIRCVGNTYYVSFNGSAELNFTDTSAPTGTIGFAQFGGGGFYVDDLSVIVPVV